MFRKRFQLSRREDPHCGSLDEDDVHCSIACEDSESDGLSMSETESRLSHAAHQKYKCDSRVGRELGDRQYGSQGM